LIGITEKYDPVFTNDWKVVGRKVEVCGEPSSSMKQESPNSLLETT